MENKVEKCPKCGNYVEGKVQYSQDEKITRVATTKGVSWLYGAIPGALIGSIFVPPIGTILGFALGAYISSTIGNDTADAVGNELFKDADFTFTCPKCGNRWKRHLLKNTDYTPDKVLLNEKNEIISSLKSEKGVFGRLSIFSAIIAVPTMWYCIKNDFKENIRTESGWFGDYETCDYNYLWPFLAIICFFAILGFIVNLLRYADDAQIKELEKMTTEDFRGSEIRYKHKRGEV